MAGEPTVTTNWASSATTTIAIATGYITNLGTAAVTEHGHCWATTANPTTSNDKTTAGASPQTGSFSSVMTSLTPGTLYYVRAYATNSNGTGYGSDMEITTASAAWRRHLWIEEPDVHYFDQYGVERKIQGVGIVSDPDILSHL